MELDNTSWSTTYDVFRVGAHATPWYFIEHAMEPLGTGYSVPHGAAWR